jgi:hypothetical protein
LRTAQLTCANLCTSLYSWSSITTYKKAGARRLRLSSWLCARIKIDHVGEGVARAPPPLPVETRLAALLAYALLRGRTVKSRTCARMLDICIPFSCDRYGKTSATN